MWQVRLPAGSAEADQDCAPAHRRDLRQRHGKRSRLHLLFKLEGPENLSILAVNILAVNRPLPIHTVIQYQKVSYVPALRAFLGCKIVTTEEGGSSMSAIFLGVRQAGSWNPHEPSA